ncbi:MAG: DNA-processing protein DprA [Candidatus Pacebacteria bacterium]|nr:DNA-processing protein DprA [Candidatus Paceibacterota bacterium]
MSIDNSFKEKICYNAVNIALGGDYGKIKKIKINSWEESWLKIKSGLSKISPEKEFEKINDPGIELILAEEESFPKALKEMPWPPFGIYKKGKLPEKKRIAIVGTRRVTPQGKLTARQIAKNLAQNGITIISGLALGVDEAAHQGALDASGLTIAVLPTGLGNIYPRQNQQLAEKIIERGGALKSEFPLNYRPYESSFIQRNRIVSALSIATIVIEAPEKSGALSTARFALEQNREILVLPGSANHPNYKGSHKLIREGARLITCAEEILEDLGIESGNQTEQLALIETNSDERMVLEAISRLGWPASIDKIAEATKIQIQKINQIIAFLTIKGILK